MTKVLVIYHGRCADGICAAWCADLYHRNIEDVKVEYYPAVHNKPPPYKRIARADKTYVLDFCYPREDLVKMQEVTELKVIDHHKSAEADCRGLDFCEFDMDRSGAGMSWDHFFPGVDRPWHVDYIETRDIWTWKYPDAVNVLNFLDTMPLSFVTYDKLYDGDIPFRECADKGEAITEYVNMYNKEVAEAATRYINFRSPGGTIHCNVPIVNASYKGISLLVHDICQHADFGIGWFKRHDGKYQFSVRVSEKSDFDASKLCKEFGGGGHAKASGFTLPHEIEELRDEKQPLGIWDRGRSAFNLLLARN
jgi:oligoribonuclease NrnB/cAMP/cGMP phosphodiesterase (DHH superfamily)